MVKEDILYLGSLLSMNLKYENLNKSKHFRLFIIAAGCSLKLSPQLPVIQTENGFVSGYKSDDISIFKGIPFAAPPVGKPRSL